jgi:type I restriction enzyme S subunit
MKYKAYERYKDSGVPWLGDIPEAWETSRLNEAVKLKTSNVDKKTEDGETLVKLCNYVDVYYNDKITSKIEFMSASATPLEIGKFTLKRGDVVLTKDSESPSDIGIPALIDEDIEDLVCGYHLAILNARPERTWGPFVFYAVKSRPSAAQFEVLANGITRFGLSQSDLKNLQFALPTIPDQKVIAAFLDEKTAEIDGLIAKKEALLKALAEKRTAIITHAVTKGLNPTAKMKPSGVPWLGDIPEHWEVKKVSYEYEVQLGKMLQPEPRSVDDELLPYLRAANLAWAGVDLNDVKEMWVSPREKLKYGLRRGDILVSEGGDVGRSSYWDNDRVIYIQNAINRLRPHSIVMTHSKFGYYWFSFLKNSGLIDIVCNSSTISHYTAEKVKSTEILSPPPDQQKAIAVFLDEKTAEIDGTIEIVKDAISKLKEYRTSLITNAVTGKIKVV